MSDYRILICGSRTWEDRAVIHDALHTAANHAETSGRLDPQFDRIVVVHGGAPGADWIAGDIARQWGLPVEVHRADWKTYGSGAGPHRNKIMVGLGADVCLSFPLGESRGTRHCMAAAARAGIPVIDHDPALTTSPQVREWLADADSRLALPSVPDDPSEIQRRIDQLRETT